jgi:hypothetical protein
MFIVQPNWGRHLVVQATRVTVTRTSFSACLWGGKVMAFPRGGFHGA